MTRCVMALIEPGRSRNYRADMVVIGGGPAGASTAIRAVRTLRQMGSGRLHADLRTPRPVGQQHERVLVLESRYGDSVGRPITATHETAKPCGGFVMGSGVDYLREQLGIDLSAIPHVPINHLTVSNMGHYVHGQRRVPYEHLLSRSVRLEAPGWGITVHRHDLDPLLLNHARDEGARVMTGTTVQRIHSIGDDFVVEGTGPEGEFQATTSMLVGAFGANAAMRSAFLDLMGTQLPESANRTGTAFRLLADRTETALVPDGGIHLTFFHFPLRGEPQTGTSFLWHYDAPGGGINAGSVFLRAEHRDRVPMEYSHRLAAETLFPEFQNPRDIHGAALPIYVPGHLPPAKITGQGVVVLRGDAAGVANPLTGGGIAEALEGGEIGTVMARTIVSGDRAPLQRYVAEEGQSPMIQNLAIAHAVAEHIVHNPNPAVLQAFLGALETHPFTGRVGTDFLSRKEYELGFLGSPRMMGIGARLIMNGDVRRALGSMARDPLMDQPILGGGSQERGFFGRLKPTPLGLLRLLLRG